MIWWLFLNGVKLFETVKTFTITNTLNYYHFNWLYWQTRRKYLSRFSSSFFLSSVFKTLLLQLVIGLIINFLEMSLYFWQHLWSLLAELEICKNKSTNKESQGTFPKTGSTEFGVWMFRVIRVLTVLVQDEERPETSSTIPAVTSSGQQWDRTVTFLHTVMDRF